MDDHWKTLPNAHRVLLHADDARPTWLWSQDGQRLIWQNATAGLFLARLKKHGLKPAAPAVPIKGQVARIIRLGSASRSSLARIQFLSGDKPVSATCTTTPLAWAGDEMALLIVAVDPITADILDAASAHGAAETLLTEDPAYIETVSTDLTEAAHLPAAPDLPPVAGYASELENWRAADAETVYEPLEEPDEPPFSPAADTDQADHWSDALADEAQTEILESSDAALAESESDRPRADASESGRLSSLFDRLAADEALYSALDESDALPPLVEDAQVIDKTDADAPIIVPDLEAEFGPEETQTLRGRDEPRVSTHQLYKVTGRGFVAAADTGSPPQAPEAIVSAEPDRPSASEVVSESSTPPEMDRIDHLRAALEALDAEEQRDEEAVERVSRYNFDELSRILTDRVGERSARAADAPPAAAPATSGALINLGGETLVLNRLPLGILVFRDQQILFANRAITEMVGYESVERLRAAGLAAVFPATGPDGRDAGPVNHLVQRDGTLVPVTARLQSMSWQGRPALMLSASSTEVRTGHEDAVRAFAQTISDTLGEGYFETSRTGLINQANSAAVTALGGGRVLIGQSLANLIGEDDAVAFQAFLDRPARFAESSRPCLPLRARDGKSDIMLFASGQAGTVSGYFGLVRHRQTMPARLSMAADMDPALLSRISRGVRRPLNTIVGFADLLRTKAFGDLGSERYLGYADDIARAGHEITALVDELDDYARLRDGRYLPQRASLELTELLESCVLRIRDQANLARVIVRNAISETLPRVTADRASLTQAVLNLLASAIDQTPIGGAVVISAQRHDDGAIAIHVRDSSAHAVDMAERFVVFRDGVDRGGQALGPVRSSVGLALTRSLLAVNAVSLSVDPAGSEGMLFTLKIPADLVDDRQPVADPQEK